MKKNFLIILIIVLVFLAFGGAVVGIIYASEGRVVLDTNSHFEYVPNSGIRYNASLDCFDVSNYYGLTYIGSNIVVDTKGLLGGSVQEGFSKAASNDSSYRQVSDITYLSDYKTKAYSSFPTNTTFYGIYDGQGYTLINCPTIAFVARSHTSLFATSIGTIKNVKIFSDAQTALGNSLTGDGTSTTPSTHSFLVYDNKGTIENCIAEGSYTNSSRAYNNLGIFAIKSSGVIKNCTNNMNLNLTGENSYLAGIVCLATAGTIIGNTNNGNLTGTQHIGGIISGYLNSSNCSTLAQLDVVSNINNGAITGSSSHIGGILGYVNATATINFISNTNNGQINATSSVGGLFGYIATSSDVNLISNTNTAYVKCSSSAGGIAGVIALAASNKEALIKNNYNEGKIESSDCFAGGILGSLTSYYNESSKFIIQSNINNGEINSGSSSGGIVASLHLLNNTIHSILGNTNNGRIVLSNNGSSAAGIIAGMELHSCIIDGNKNTGYVVNNSINANHIAGIVAFGDIYSDITLRNNHNTGKIETKGEYVAGISGTIDVLSNDTIISISLHNNTNDAEIKAASFVGGILAYVYCNLGNKGHTLSVTSNTNNGNITATSDGFIGGIIGYVEFDKKTSVIESNTNNGIITSNGEFTGGIIGKTIAHVRIDIAYNTNNGAVTTTSDNVGGIIGMLEFFTNSFSANISRNTNNGKIVSTYTLDATYIAAICGSFYGNGNSVALTLEKNINSAHILLATTATPVNLYIAGRIQPSTVTVSSSAGNTNTGILGYNYNTATGTYKTIAVKFSNRF